jgi:hypothetical protein
MEKAVAEELCGFLDELSLLAAETYRKVKALEQMTEHGHFTQEAFRQGEGRTDAAGRLVTLTASVAKLRQALHLSPKAPPALPEKPDPVDLSFLKEDE